MEQALEAGAEIDAVVPVTPQASLPAIMHAAMEGATEIVEYLLTEGADPEVPDSATPRYARAFRLACAALLSVV
eukprot:SAG11_NODE_9498_length_906_cov_1.861214_2_plen_73_part_01